MTNINETTEDAKVAEDSSSKKSNAPKIPSKVSLAIIALIVLCSGGFYLYKMYGGNLPTSSSDSQLTNSDTAYDKNTYNKEYFDKALAENRVLNPEEQYAYYAMSLEGKETTIASSIINNEEVKCMIDDSPMGEATVDFNIDIKNGNIRIDLNDIKNSETISEAGLIAKNEGFWSWSPSNESMNGYVSFKNRTEKLALIVTALQGVVDDPAVYSSSCKEESVDDSRFDAPKDIEFQDMTQSAPAVEEEAPAE